MTDHVFLGSKFGAADRALLDALKIRAVVNLTAGRTRVPNHFEGSGIEYLHLELTDELLSNPSLALPQACKAIHSWGKENRNVLVHCHAGLSRSATVVLAWMMRHRGLSLAEGTELFMQRRGRRPKCNPSFWCYLAALERELRGWAPGTPPSFDFTAWLLEDLAKMGLKQDASQIVRALQQDADWVDFTLFYTSVSGWGLKTLLVAQRVAQQNAPEVRLACKAANVACELMEVYHMWPALLAFCLRILQPLVAHSDSKPSEHIFALGAVSKTITAMQAHSDTADVQESGCATLAYLAARREDCAKEVSLLGGIECVINAMRAHLADEKVQTTGCVTLLVLSHSPHCKARLADLGGLDTLLIAMRTHLFLPKLQELGCKAIVGMVKDAHGMTDFYKFAAYDVVLMALQAHPADAGVQQHATDALLWLGNGQRIENASHTAQFAKEVAPNGGMVIGVRLPGA